MYVCTYKYIYNIFQNVLPPFVLCGVATPSCYANCCSHSLALYLNTVVCINMYITVCMCVYFFSQPEFFAVAFAARILTYTRAFVLRSAAGAAAALLPYAVTVVLSLHLLCATYSPRCFGFVHFALHSHT